MVDKIVLGVIVIFGLFMTSTISPKPIRYRSTITPTPTPEFQIVDDDYVNVTTHVKGAKTSISPSYRAVKVSNQEAVPVQKQLPTDVPVVAKYEQQSVIVEPTQKPVQMPTISTNEQGEMTGWQRTGSKTYGIPIEFSFPKDGRLQITCDADKQVHFTIKKTHTSEMIYEGDITKSHSINLQAGDYTIHQPDDTCGHYTLTEYRKP